ncbi:MAG TPA: hypothetical protein PKD26_07055 [Pyrinomonadaceae bacterium]|nr:hypothetical protein [Pyrinomonadaceae bacterium]
MKRSISTFLVTSFIALIFVGLSFGQSVSKYSYQAQKALIPADLGQVYLGMPLKDLAARIDISKAEADDRFEYLQLEIPYEKGSITSLAIRVHGLSEEQTKALLVEESVTKRSSDGTAYNETVKRPKTGSISGGIVYAMYIEFRKGFDLRSWAEKAYGKGEIRPKDDPYHFFDQQWMKRSSDGLGWTIRVFYEEEGRTLQLLGRIPGTEWDPEA